jgi:hypothetical protein
MREIASFLMWLVLLIVSLVLINYIAKLIGAPSDVALLLSCFPIIAALGIGINEGHSGTFAAVMTYAGWFYGAFLAFMVTAFILSLIV